MSNPRDKLPGRDDFPVTKDDRLFLNVDDNQQEESTDARSPWKLLVVDDEKEVHAVTRLALGDFVFAGRTLEFLSAFSGAEAKQILQDNPDVALILLDVVMETDEAGLDVAQYVRKDLDNHYVRIILRTGQPGIAPERQIMTTYDINDYRAKTELTRDRLFAVIHTALSSYRDLVSLARNRHRLTETIKELNRSNHELEQFAYIVSHDLQEPLRNVVSFAQILQREYQDKLGASANEYIRFVVDSAAHMQRLVQALLTFSKIGRGGANLGWHDLNDIVEETKTHLKQTLDERKVTIESQQLPVMQVDAELMVRLMQNLISNAIKFQPGESPVVRIAARHAPDAWVLSVADEGIGIHSRHSERIFQIFQRLHTSDEYEGSGIGLSICEKIARLHNGRIWVESEPGKGSTFFISIPDHREQPA